MSMENPYLQVQPPPKHAVQMNGIAGTKKPEFEHGRQGTSFLSLSWRDAKCEGCTRSLSSVTLQKQHKMLFIPPGYAATLSIQA